MKSKKVNLILSCLTLVLSMVAMGVVLRTSFLIGETRGTKQGIEISRYLGKNNPTSAPDQLETLTQGFYALEGWKDYFQLALSIIETRLDTIEGSQPETIFGVPEMAYGTVTGNITIDANAENLLFVDTNTTDLVFYIWPPDDEFAEVNNEGK